MEPRCDPAPDLKLQTQDYWVVLVSPKCSSVLSWGREFESVLED